MVHEAMAHRLNSVGVNKVIQSVIMPTALFVFTYANCAGAYDGAGRGSDPLVGETFLETETTGGREWKRDTGRRAGDEQIMDIINGCPMAKMWCTNNNERRLSGIMLESGVLRSDVPDDIRREIQKRADEKGETGEGKMTSYGQGPWNNMKAKAEAMRGWWVEKGTNRMEVKGVHRIAGKWYVRGYAYTPKAKTRRCAPSTRMVWWKVKACSRQGDNTVEKGEVSRRIVEQKIRELASQDYWMIDENLKLRSEWMWRLHVDREAGNAERSGYRGHASS
jgi:hypothetical protein